MGSPKANSKSRGVLILLDRNFRRSDGGRSKVTRWLQTHILSAPYLSALTPTLQNRPAKSSGFGPAAHGSHKASLGLKFSKDETNSKRTEDILKETHSCANCKFQYLVPNLRHHSGKYQSAPNIWREPPVRAKSLDCVSAAPQVCFRLEKLRPLAPSHHNVPTFPGKGQKKRFSSSLTGSISADVGHVGPTFASSWTPTEQ